MKGYRHEIKNSVSAKCTSEQFNHIYNSITLDCDFDTFRSKCEIMQFEDMRHKADLHKELHHTTLKQFLYGIMVDNTHKQMMCDCRHCGEWFNYTIIAHHEEECHAKGSMWQRLIEMCGKEYKHDPINTQQKLLIVDLVLSTDGIDTQTINACRNLKGIYENEIK